MLQIVLVPAINIALCTDMHVFDILYSYWRCMRRVTLVRKTLRGYVAHRAAVAQALA
jgi:hypothetical protein